MCNEAVRPRTVQFEAACDGCAAGCCGLFLRPGQGQSGYAEQFLGACSRGRALNSMKPIPNGAQGQYVHRVESDHLANRFKDSILPPVFSTPYLILIMENAALNAIKQYLEAGESAVGTRIDVRHLVATPVGREVVGHAEVTGTDGRKISSACGRRTARKRSAPGPMTHARQRLAHRRANDGEVRVGARSRLIRALGAST